MKFRYEYNKDFQTLQQFDENSGKLISSMSMPIEDLHRISFLDWMLAVDETSDFSSEAVDTYKKSVV